jgi:hypothetical protein
VPSASKITGPLGMAIAVVLSCKKKRKKKEKSAQLEILLERSLSPPIR